MFIKLSIHQLPPPPSIWLSVALSTWLQKDWLTTELPITLGVGWVISLSAWLSIGTVVILGGRVIHLQSNTSINLSLSVWLRIWTVVILGGGDLLSIWTVVMDSFPVVPECPVPSGGEHPSLVLPPPVDVGDSQGFPRGHQSMEWGHSEHPKATQGRLGRLGSTTQQHLKKDR